MRLHFLPIFAALAAFALPAQAHGPEPLRRAPFYSVLPGEAVGCYWERGRQFCGHYCYWEVNGRRYCQRRERLAVPQGAWFDDYVLDEGRSTLYRRPYSRLRRSRPHNAYNVW